MNISPILNNQLFSFKTNTKKINKFDLKELKQDTVSFLGKRNRRNLVDEMKKLSAEDFPSPSLRDYMLTQLDNPDNEADISQIHKDYYSRLLGCKSLDEAKEIYPEFKNVINAKDIDQTKLNYNSVLKAIANGEIKGASIENLSLQLLKKYYAELFSFSNKSEYFNFSTEGTGNLFKKLNIGLNKKYMSLIRAQIASNAATERNATIWTDKAKADMSEKKLKFYTDHPETKQTLALATTRYFVEHPEARTAVSERNLARTDEEIKRAAQKRAKFYVEHPEARTRASERMLKFYDEHPKARLEASERMLKFYDKHPEAKQKASLRMIKFYDEHPEARLEASLRMLRFCEEHPEEVIRLRGLNSEWDEAQRMRASKRTKKYFEEHPDARTKLSKSLKDFYIKHPKARQEASKRTTRYYIEHPKARLEASERMLRFYNEHPKARLEASERTSTYLQEHPEKRLEHSEKIKQYWQKPEVREFMAIVYIARKLAWQIHPSAQDVYSDTAKDFPILGKIIAKKSSGAKLSDKELRYLSSYYAACYRNHPEINSEVGQIQKAILNKWGFYDDDRDIKEIIMLVNSDMEAGLAAIE